VRLPGYTAARPVGKILDGPRRNDYEPTLRIEDIQYHDGGPSHVDFPPGEPAEPCRHVRSVGAAGARGQQPGHPRRHQDLFPLPPSPTAGSSARTRLSSSAGRGRGDVETRGQPFEVTWHGRMVAPDTDWPVITRSTNVALGRALHGRKNKSHFPMHSGRRSCYKGCWAPR
jgi:hypothetical protein